MVGELTTRNAPVTETEVDPPAESVDAPGTGTDGAGHVIETGRGGVAHGIATATVGGADHVIGIAETEGGVTDRGLVRGSAQPSLWQIRRERDRRRRREREGTTRVGGERHQYGGTWHLEDLSIFHRCNTRLCKVHTQGFICDHLRENPAYGIFCEN